ncbi:MAG: [FeFe] hydrogenase H-cluster radical SAM maturase HydE [Lachnoclostridium edouardi]|uniref:[FeFe] hydrogenase H-cluster radical SAM maturase HydE n=1 Tax=Lachnoclostridium edouardi TaxID=1926283 RepID=UPI0026DD4F83|nr:[FeFe] hydrogenase H-cluster radical SAM maturase HydE [Lachnoclostridium edouardi]MDO4277542.1 [FeFe] hydrogenase H-cluster radical SAM maturase HydE [Lachnoclostridium edouardi]
MRNLINKLRREQRLENEEWKQLLEAGKAEREGGAVFSLEENDSLLAYSACQARQVREEIFGKAIYIRGLIEFTSYCKNDCYYCGLRRSNKEAERYRLNQEEILSCCRKGYELGFRTFVLQGGEDGRLDDQWMEQMISRIKNEFSNCALTLSVGERERKTYLQWKNAGADRYLLRHETADSEHYKNLHPKELSLARRLDCLRNLKDLGYQTGCGIMVGSPGQTTEALIKDMEFMKMLQPEMVGIGPFLPQHSTPFAGEKAGTLEETLFLLSLIRLMLPKVLLPATTALGTVREGGREMGILCGANVVMPNLSPADVRKKYLLYDNKICTGDEAAESLSSLKKSMEKIGYEIVTDRGDSPMKKEREKHV